MGPQIGADDHLNEALLIGPRLRRARLRRKLSLDELARSTGLSKGFISQLERDMTSASVASLVRLCDAVGITVGSLFQPSETVLTSAATAPLINFGGSGLRERLLTPRGSSDLQLIRSEVEPGGGSGAEPYALDAKAEVVHILRGELVVTLDDEIYTLRAGDTLTFSPRQGHAWHNPSETEQAVVLWVLAPSPW
jgi:transcriptional regulator with XRE-family HTH domain